MQIVYLLITLKVKIMKIKGEAVFLDDLDLEILQVLEENSKRTYTEIGRLLGVAHSTVYDRIRKMEKQGIIRKYTVILDLEKAGVKYITAVMTVFTDPKESENVAKRLSGLEQVLEVSTSLSEELLIIAKVVAEDQEKLHSFIAHSVAPLPGVLRIRTSIVTRKYKEECANSFFQSRGS
ncbi:MAG: Lrp/AsnC family transcriptional regulator [Candidatus Bathyarchaeota archaeon]|nr:Lrp/AsnC family transcriptional regulator [Candidatus Bathyarchaeota archaeon]